ncbi:MAG: PAS domain S-box protein [Candidatus Omnitrophota bacterium]
MKRRLNVLIVEDSEDIAWIIAHKLNSGDYDVDWTRVETSEKMKEALDNKSWDLIIADYFMPNFSGEEALALYKERGKNIPFIIVSSTISEEAALSLIRAGANGYIEKTRLERLVPCVEKELSIMALIKEKKESEEKFKTIFEYAPDCYYLSDLKGNLIDGNRMVEEIIGYRKEELIGKNFFQLNMIVPRDLPKAAAELAANVSGKSTGPTEYTLIRKDGSKVSVETRTFPVKIKDKTLILGIARDITKRKEMEKVSKERLVELEIFYKASIGREERIVELKKEIEELKKRLAKYEK